MNTLVVESALQRARDLGADEAEICYNATRIHRLGVRNRQIVDTKFSFSHGVAIRVLVGGQAASGYVESTEPDQVHAMMAQVLQYARTAPLRETFVCTPPGLANGELKMGPGAYSAIPVEEKRERAVRAEQTARETIGDAALTHAFYGEFRNEVVVANTHGLMTGYAEERGEVLLGVQVRRDGEMVRVAGTTDSRSPSEIDVAGLAARLAGRARRRLGAIRPTAGRGAVILSPRAGAQLLRVFSPIFFAESLPLSGLAGKVGSQIAAPMVSLVDDPTLDLAGMRPVDDEGNPTRRRTVVRNGVLADYLYNNAAAARLGQKQGGSSFRRSFKTRVITAASNLYLEPGTISPELLMAQVETGVYVDELFGLEGTFHWEYPRFSIRAVGFRLAGGAIAEPLQEFTLQGNFLKALGRVEGVACDLSWDSASNRQQFGAPTILLADMDIGV